jgi:hypothetical protein
MQIEGVPEASTWAMMIAGFAVLGLSIRRKKAARLHAPLLRPSLSTLHLNTPDLEA